MPNTPAGPNMTIAIGPGLQPGYAGQGCPAFAATPASVRVNGTFAFKNNMTVPVTIVGSSGTPWVTLSPGQTSSSLTFSSAGSYPFGAGGCSGTSSDGRFVMTVFYGAVVVTIG